MSGKKRTAGDCPAGVEDHAAEHARGAAEHAHHDHTHHDHTHHGHAHSHDEHTHTHAHHACSSSVGPVITVRAVSGLSGDMMLAGLAGLAELTQKDIDALLKEMRMPGLEACLSIGPRSVNHIAGLGCRIELPHEHAHRTFADIRKIIQDSAMPDTAKEMSVKAFGILAEAEAAVHGRQMDDVAFHEVGALDSILDTCLSCRIFSILSPGRFICSPLPLADGVIRCAHGLVPSPAPAVLRMLHDVPVCGFSGTGETVTPTALSLLKALGADFGPWPSITVSRTVISYGGKVFVNAPNGAVWALGR